MSRIIMPEKISGCGDIIFLNNRHHMSLGGFAFQGCSSMTSIELPAGLKSISKAAFYGCSSMTSIALPAGLTSLGEGAFAGCSSMTAVPRLPMLL